MKSRDPPDVQEVDAHILGFLGLCLLSGLFPGLLLSLLRILLSTRTMRHVNVLQSALKEAAVASSQESRPKKGQGSGGCCSYQGLHARSCVLL